MTTQGGREDVFSNLTVVEIFLLQLVQITQLSCSIQDSLLEKNAGKSSRNDVQANEIAA